MEQRWKHTGRIKYTITAVFIIIIFVFPEISLAQQLDSLSLSNAIKISFENNKEIAALKKEIDKSIIDIQIASRIFQENPEINSALKNRLASDNNIIDFEVSLSLPIEVRGQRQYRKEIAEINLQIAKLSLQKKKIEIITDLKKIFSDIYILEEKEKNLNEILRIEENLKEYIKTKVKHGELSQVELNIVMLEVSNTEEELLTLKQEISAKRKELELIMNRRVSQNTKIIFEPINPSNIPEVKKITSYAERNNPDIKIASLYVKKASANLDIIKANSILPKVIPSIIFSREDRDNIFGIGVTIPLPILNRKLGEISGAHSKEEKYILLKQNICQKITLDLKKDYEALNIINMKKRIYKKEILSVTQQSLNSIKLLYQKGEIGLPTLERFWDNWVRTKIGYLNLLQNYYHTLFRIELLAGGNLGDIANKTKDRR